MKKYETVIQDNIEAGLKKLQKDGFTIIFERRIASSANYKKGSADFWMSLNGYHIEVEIKTETGKRSTLQETWERWCRKNHSGYMLVRSFDDLLTQILNFLEVKQNDKGS